MTETTGSLHRLNRWLCPPRVKLSDLKFGIDVPMPTSTKLPQTARLLELADELCSAACEICNQGEEAEPWRNIPFTRSPDWAYENLSKALNAYYEARHRHD